MKIFYIFLTLTLFYHIEAVPFQDLIKYFEEDPEFTAGYFEGDIVLDEERNGLRDKSKLWPNNTVFYRIANGFFDTEHVNHIINAMHKIESISCIRFKEATPDQTYYANITGYSDGCYAQVGYENSIRTYNLKIYPLDTGCFRIGVIMHELLHLIGFRHMHSSTNRDDYIQIIEENISKENIHNFRKFNIDQIDDFDEKYDYGSILHYGPYAFSKNGKKTIIPLNEKEAAGIMGQRREMSKRDINRLNIMYQCPLNI